MYKLVSIHAPPGSPKLRRHHKTRHGLMRYLVSKEPPHDLILYEGDYVTATGYWKNIVTYLHHQAAVDRANQAIQRIAGRQILPTERRERRTLD